MSDLYRDFIDQKADQIINSLGGTITPAVPNELYRDFLDRKFDDVINALGKTIKYYEYVGSDTSTLNPTTHTLVLPEKFTAILSITGKGNTEYSMHDVIYNGYTSYFISYNFHPSINILRSIGIITSYTDNGITLQSSSAGNVFNYKDITYRVLYI